MYEYIAVATILEDARFPDSHSSRSSSCNTSSAETIHHDVQICGKGVSDQPIDNIPILGSATLTVKSRTKNKTVVPPPKWELLGNAGDLLTYGRTHLAVRARDWRAQIWPGFKSTRPQRYISVSPTSDLVHYIIEPLYERRFRRIVGSDAGNRVGYVTDNGHALEYKTNTATNSYSGLLKLDERGFALQERALNSVLPQADAEALKPLAEMLAGELGRLHGDEFSTLMATGDAANMAALVGVTHPQTIWGMDSVRITTLSLWV